MVRTFNFINTFKRKRVHSKLAMCHCSTMSSLTRVMQRSICENLLWFLVIEHQTCQLYEIASYVNRDSSSEFLLTDALFVLPVEVHPEISSQVLHTPDTRSPQFGVQLPVHRKEARPEPLRKTGTQNMFTVSQKFVLPVTGPTESWL